MEEDSLKKYELGLTKVPNTVVALMVDTYNAPELKEWYCSNECPLGYDCREVQDMPPERALIRLYILHVYSYFCNLLFPLCSFVLVQYTYRKSLHTSAALLEFLYRGRIIRGIYQAFFQYDAQSLLYAAGSVLNSEYIYRRSEHNYPYCQEYLSRFPLPYLC